MTTTTSVEDNVAVNARASESFVASVAFLDLVDCQLPCDDSANIGTDSAIVTEATAENKSGNNPSRSDGDKTDS